MAPAPAPCLLTRRQLAGLNRLVHKETFQIVGQFVRGAVALSGFFAQAFQADRFEIAMDRGIESGKTWRLLFRERMEKCECIVSFERQPAREHLKEDHTQAVNVAGGRGGS